MDTIVERVARGLAWILDEGARYDVDISRVDLDSIDMASTVDCVLGQARGGYGEPDSTGFRRPGYGTVLTALTEDGTIAPTMLFGPAERERWAYAHGFLTFYRESGNVVGLEHAFDVLRDAWAVAITAHRAAQTVS